jgi:UbiD family decarboxylase
MDFRTYLQILEQAGDLIRINKPVKMEYEAGAICRQLSDADGPAVLMAKIGETEWPLAANVFGTRRRIAWALGTTEGEMLEYVAQRLKSRIEPVPFKGDKPRCQEVVIEGDDVDIQKLPIPLWNVGDGGRYITAGMFIARHPEFGWNIAHHRGQIYGPREIGICMAPEHHLRFVADDGRARGERAGSALRSNSPRPRTSRSTITNSALPGRSKAGRSKRSNAGPLTSRCRKIPRS